MSNSACCLWVIFSLQTLVAGAEVSPTSPRVEKVLDFPIGESIADLARPYVHILKKGGNELHTLNTETGEFIAATALQGVPGFGAVMCFSLDGEKLYVPLTSSQRVQIIGAETLETEDILHLDFPPGSVAYGADENLYIYGGERIYKVDRLTGRTLGVSGDSFYRSMIIKSGFEGERIFTMELGISGGGAMIDEYALTRSNPPLVHTNSHVTSGSANNKDFEIDEAEMMIFSTAGGDYGINAWDLETRTQQFWPYDEPYGVAVAHLPGSPFVYGASGSNYDPRIRRFQKSTGIPSGDFDLADGAIEDRSLHLTPNGYIFYARDEYRIGVIGRSTLGEILPVAGSIDGGPDVELDQVQVLHLPVADWSRVSGPGTVGFTENGNEVVATFQLGGEFVLRGSSRGTARVHHDLIHVKVPTPLMTIISRQTASRWLVPTNTSDLEEGDAKWYEQGFDDALWQEGSAAVGYERRAEGTFDEEIGTEVSGPMYNKNASLLLRTEFEFAASPEQVEQLWLRVKSDDGFVAYLNGEEVARFNASPEVLAWNAFAPADTPDATALKYQEFDLSAFRAVLRQRENVLGLHGLNEGPSSQSFLQVVELAAAVVETPYTLWVRKYPELQGEGSAESADPDSDNLPNYAEFLTGGNPLVVVREDPDIFRPRAVIVREGEDAFLEFEHARMRGIAEDTYQIVFSEDLSAGSWRLGGTTRFPTEIVSLSDSDNPEFEWVRQRLLTPIDERSSVFVQMRVLLNL